MFIKLEEEDLAPRRQKRSVPIVIIILIIAAVAIKIQFYSWNFFQEQELGDPFPIAAQEPLSDPGQDAATPTSIPSQTPPRPAADLKPPRPPPKLSKPHLATTYSNQPIAGPDTAHHHSHGPITKARQWQSYKTETFHAANMEVSKIGAYTPGYLFCTPGTLRREETTPMIMTDDNELVWSGPPGVSTNFRIQQFDGSPHMTYWQTEDRMSQGHAYGAFYVMDGAYNVIHKICPQDLNIVTNDGRNFSCSLDMHLSVITNRDTLLITAYNVTQWDFSRAGGPEDGWIYDAVFYEIDIKTKEIIYRWRSLDHIDELPLNYSRMPFQRMTQAGGNRPAGETRHAPWDYFHINSVQLLDDGYLINSRASWSVIKIHRNGSLDWRLQGEDGGDFTLDKGIFFSWQHDSRAISANATHVELMMFNNGMSGYSPRENKSRAYHLALDLRKRHATLVRDLVDRDHFDTATAMGNWQKLPNDHVLVNYGYTGVVKEFDENNNVTFEAKFGAVGFRSFASSFAVFRLDWHATPSQPPKVVAEYTQQKNETRVWMSWNGATDYDLWTVSSGKEEDDLEVVETAERTGFETMCVLQGKHEWVQVEAGQGSTSLRSSDVVETVVLSLKQIEESKDADAHKDDSSWELNLNDTPESHDKQPPKHQDKEPPKHNDKVPTHDDDDYDYVDDGEKPLPQDDPY